MIRLTNRNYLVSKIMISINMASKYINEKLSLRKRNGGHMWVNNTSNIFEIENPHETYRQS